MPINLPTVIGAVIVFGIVLLIIFRGIKNKKAGKGGCGCDCENCSGSDLCHPQK